jgi:NADH-quinone oxidoreductase subunit K
MNHLNITGDISVMHYLVLSAAIFVIGVCGLLTNRQNMISILMSIELMLLAVNVNFIAFSVLLQDLGGQIFTILILTVAAAESAIGLAIIMQFFRGDGNINIANANRMRG